MINKRGISKNKKKIAVRCECGFIASGNSEAHAEANLKLHRKSKQHKKIISMNQDISNGELTDISGANLIKIKEANK